MFELSNGQIDEYINTIEIDLTTFCNLNCQDCARGCDRFPSTDLMCVKEVYDFVYNSIELGKKWKKIGLLGGEPTLHPNIYTIVELLGIYREKYNDVDIWMMTNGIKKDTINQLKIKYPWLNIWVNTDHSYHHAFYISPSDLELMGSNSRCEALRCGIGLGPYGYTPCVLGSFLHRVFGYTTIKYLKDVTYERCQELFSEYCQHCGWYLVDSNDKRKGLATEYPHGHMSPTWEKMYEGYNNI